MEKSKRNKGLQSIADILQQTLFSDSSKPSATTELQVQKQAITLTTAPTGRYDFDLAEFPFFHFDKNPAQPLKDPITYTDTITGKDGQPVIRQWKVYPSAAYGFGGPTAAESVFRPACLVPSSES